MSVLIITAYLTRLYATTNNLVDVASHLRHTDLDTSRIYAKWSGHAVKNALADWKA